MRRFFQSAQIAIALVLLLSIAGGLTSQVRAQDEPEEVSNVAVVVPSARTNLGWDQQAADGLDTVAERLGITSQVQENGGYDDITPILKDLKDGGAQLIICHASGYQTTCPEFADAEGVPVAVIENPNAVVPGLVSDYETEAQEVAYLAGVLAGEMTSTGTIGIVVSDQSPTWNFMVVGFAEGLKATNPDADLIYSVIGQAAYDDAVGAKRVTEQQLAAGADIIFGMGDGASFGMIEAVREHNEDSANADTPAMFIDVIGDKREDYSDVLLTSVLFDYTGIFGQMIADLESGEFGKVYTMSIENGGVRLLDLPESVPTEVQEIVKTAEAQIVNEEIEVSAIGDVDGMNSRLSELGY